MKREYMTEQCYPEKISLERFFMELKQGEVPFSNNMANLHNLKPRYIEEWMDTYSRWMEIHQPEKDD